MDLETSGTEGHYQDLGICSASVASVSSVMPTELSGTTHEPNLNSDLDGISDFPDVGELQELNEQNISGVSIVSKTENTQDGEGSSKEWSVVVMQEKCKSKEMGIIVPLKQEIILEDAEQNLEQESGPCDFSPQNKRTPNRKGAGKRKQAKPKRSDYRTEATVRKRYATRNGGANGSAKRKKAAKPGDENATKKTLRGKGKIRGRGRPPKKVQEETKKGKENKVCKICQRKFIRINFYERHMAMHESAGKKNEVRELLEKESKELSNEERGKKTKGKKKQSISGKRSGIRPAPGKLKLTHLRKTKLLNQEFPCRICGKVFHYRSSLFQHRSVHIKNRLMCQFCDKSFSNMVIVKSHLWSMHRDLAGHKCSVCEKVYQKKIDLTYHFRTHSGERPHVCKECGKAYMRSKDLVEHLRGHTGERPYRCTECDVGFATSSSFSAHKKKHRLTPFLCTSCPRGFKEEDLLKDHLKEHLTDIPCLVCNKYFKNSNSLREHVKNMHQQEGPKETFPCTVCSKPFSKKSSLKTHMANHTDDKRFRCDVCESSYATMALLAKHMRGHGAGAYKCQICDESFLLDTELKLHTRTDHSGLLPPGTPATPGTKSYSRIKKLSCTWCLKWFDCPSALKRHVLVHTGERKFLCETCGKKCKTRSGLGQHVKCHSEGKQHMCPFCGKAFTYNGNLSVHMRIHTGEMPYSCSSCGKTFNQKSNLVTHEQKKHGIETSRVKDKSTTEAPVDPITTT